MKRTQDEKENCICIHTNKYAHRFSLSLSLSASDETTFCLRMNRRAIRSDTAASGVCSLCCFFLVDAG